MQKASILPAIFIILLLSACASSGGYNKDPWSDKNHANKQSAEHSPNNLSVAGVESQPLDAPSQNTNTGLAPVKVAILLPLSGQYAKLGHSMLNAAQMALFDIAHNNFELMPKDTKGTPEGARAAAYESLQDGAKLVIGPIFAPSVRAASQVTRSANINMIAFSTDWQLANNETFLIGFLPFDQIERIVSYAANNGYKHIGVLSPQDNYGNAVTSAYQAVSHYAGIETSSIERFSPQGNDLGTIMRKFSNYDARRAAQKAQENADIKKEINGHIISNEIKAPFDAVLMPVGGTVARQVSSFLNHYDLPPRLVRRLGTGLMDDPALATDKSLDGAWFAAPSPQARQKFERHYNSIYSAKPPRIASLAYDATALAAILARKGLQDNNRPAFDHRSITNSNGFFGVDGIFRFRPDGIVERGLAVLEYRKGSIVVIDKAPKTFQRNTNF